MTIDGQAAPTAATFDVLNPATNEVYARAPECSKEQLDTAMESSAKAFRDWRADESARRDALRQAAGILLGASGDLAPVLTAEQGKPLSDANLEIFAAGMWLQYYADLEVPREVIQDDDNAFVEVVRKPLGVVAAITPWNFPVTLASWKIAPALLAGNTMVLKPSPFTPLSTLMVGELLRDVFPPGVFNVVSGGDDLGAWMTSHPVPRKISFTGSVATGKKVNVAAAQQMIPCVLELGGKDPAIVLPDADLDTAALKVAWGAFANSGQTCASVERVYVHESIAPQLTDKLVKLAEGLRQGEPNSYDVDVGAMTTQMQVDIVKRHLEDARAKGAKVLAGGEVKVYPDGGRFVQPTVLTGVTHEMAIMRDETFGPMLPIMTFRTEEEAVRLANDSPYGLSAYVFTRDKRKADLIANQLLAGTVMHNDTLYTHAAPETPWGGVKASGLGRVHGKHGLRDLCEVRHVNLERFNFPAFWFYPYSAKAYRLGRRVYGTLIGTSLQARIKALLGK
ncbi:MAG: aldehyde dehydrogenase family protein [Actinobacteria bacterium]|nr:MAG: aldehyde dehydrogenase family protein [Actinomycetota bacterium]